jgi:hypothetical protein
MQNVALSDEGPFSARAMSRFRKFVLEFQIGANPNKKNPPPVLGDSKIFSIQNCPLDPVASHSVTAELILQECSARPECHAINILNYEGLRLYLAKDSVEFLIEEINLVVPAPFSALAVPLARITAHQEIHLREFFEVRDVTCLNARTADIVLVGLARRFPNVIRPKYLVPRTLQGEVRTAAAAEE